MAKKTTLEEELRSRCDDPRAMRGALAIVGNKPCIIFGVIADHRRFSVEVTGNKLDLLDDPRVDTEGSHAPEAGEQPKS